MRVLVTGGDGQLGRAIARLWRGHDVVAVGRADLDVTDPQSVQRMPSFHPDVVVNAAAYVDVDGCERDPDRAFRVNALGARNVAVQAARAGAVLVQVSTDYVFSGEAERPYWEFDATGPLNVYGASKLAGEDLVQAVHDRVFIVRSAWLYGVAGTSFVTRIQSLANERPSLSVVDNEVGSPTFCDDLAVALEDLARTNAYGVHHLVNEGECSRFEFARAVLDMAGRTDYGLTPANRFPRAAVVPKYAPLRNFAAAELGVRLRPWRDALAAYFAVREVEAV